MSVECFLDTNVLVYSVSAAAEDEAKRERSQALIAETDFGLSTQVLQEFFVTTTRKLERPLAVETAVALLDQYRLFPLAHTDYPLIVSAIEHSLRYEISYWDGAIVAAAEALEASVLYSEDLSDGQRYGGIEVVNPFNR